MTLDASNLALLALLGGLTGLDSVSFGQSMISRPIVAGPLAGWILGEPATGMWVGSVLEILSLRQLPIGAARSWDTGPAAVTAAAGALSWGEGAVALLVGISLGVVVGWCGSWSVHLLRQLNANLVAVDGRPLDTASSVTVRHLAALGLDLARATLLSAVGVVGASALGGLNVGDGAQPAALLALAVAAMGLGVALRMMAHGRRTWIAFCCGAVLTTFVGLWLR